MDIVAWRILEFPERPQVLRVDARFLLYFPHGCLIRPLTLFDTAAGYDGPKLGRSREVEDEKLVGARLRMQARDVRGDRRALSQLCSARILAL
jgi:hypothetical protein